MIAEAKPVQADKPTPSSSPIEHGSYDPAYFERLFSIEDRHFWFRARNLTIAAAISQVTASMPSGYRVLELGCGSRKVLTKLKETCHDSMVTGMDLFGEGSRLTISCLLVARRYLQTSG